MSQAPTAQQLFGDNPFITDPAPGGTGPGGSWKYNPRYFATPATAALVAQMLGGTVEEFSAILTGGSLKQNMLNEMVRMPVLKADTTAAATGGQDNRGYSVDPKGRAIYPGDIIALFNGQSLEEIERLISFEVGFDWHYKPAPAPVEPVMPMTPGTELLVAPIGGVRRQADDTYWKHVRDAKGSV